ncbi:hypothetical protein SAMN04488074_115157 [Lentzea albidocapillata subsp. violacea]|uniref:DUF1365 domain-containing protein n=1 Tax=Lentzea albidocapillata subsp. violacea TaxID=128104 RepID=A0A1G9PSU9_9PSEU|nr:DUF1365 domain-containing protein [Lentzea albidocapillata]SDM01872.1 hypothetical protein SAMN04488074_115157 [Lentzea albidocapillata subsp. violacea]
MIYDVVITHARRELIDRSFSHRAYMWLVDLAELPRLPWWARPFAKFEARDHLGSPSRTIRENLDEWLAGHGIDLGGGQVLMLANARVLGYVFNPLSVYWCHDASGELVCVAAEVHNTYGGRHCYLLRTDDKGRASVDKEFYVSPFLEVDGHYVMKMPKPGDQLSVTIALRQNGKTTFSATMKGERSSGLRMLLRRPLMPQRVSALIRRHGIALYLRRIPIIPRSDG